MRYKITADSTCDLGPALIERFDIGILPLYVQLGGKTFRDGVDIQPDDLYAHVAAGGDLPRQRPSIWRTISAYSRYFRSSMTL